ncbi:unnamed protein product [Trifolium pratense]|nr:unnamed protein product [Trifolium pratense]
MGTLALLSLILIVELDLDAEPSETEALLYEFSLPLMADLFDNFQDKTDLVEGDLLFLHLYFPNFLLQAKEMGFYGSKGGQRTIIFNPRVCDNVDLEVGSLIRIHPPWCIDRTKSFFAPLLATFEAVEENVEDKFYHCFIDGCWSAIETSCTVVQDVTDFCFYSYFSYMDKLRKNLIPQEKPFDISIRMKKKKKKEKQCSFFRRIVGPTCQRQLLTVKTPLNLWIADHQVTMR